MLSVLQQSVVPQIDATRDQLGGDPLTLIRQRDYPLVEVSDLQYHLDLLGVFQKLHHAVDPAGVVVDPKTKMPIMSAAQALFLARAQHRFELWTTNILERPGRQEVPLTSEEIPPVDVLLLLHSYMLNPMAYREDVIRVYPGLERMGPFPWKAIHAHIDLGTLEMTGTPSQISLWENATAEPFEPPTTTLGCDTADITCPRCLACFRVPWTTADARGLGNAGFRQACSQCGLTIDSDALCVSKLLRGLSTKLPIACTILNQEGVAEHDDAVLLSDNIREILDCPTATDGDRFSWKLSNVKAALLEEISKADPFYEWLSYVLSAYRHPGKASIDLKAAVMRQARFVQSMHDIHWAGPGSNFPGKEAALKSAVSSYERYFALTKTHASGLVPTLDVDLAFHTHQLAGPVYANDCFSIIGRFLNHDDTESNQDIHHENVRRSVDVWNDVYGEPCTPLYLPSGHGPKPNPPPCSNCNVGVHPRPKPTKPKPESDDTWAHVEDELKQHPPSYTPVNYGPKPHPRPECTNCNPDKPGPNKPKPRSNIFGEKSSLGRESRVLFTETAANRCAQLSTIYEAAGPKPPGYCSPGAPPPGRPRPTKPNHSTDKSVDATDGARDEVSDFGDSPPVYGPHGPGGGGPHGQFTNCSSIEPKPKPKPKP